MNTFKMILELFFDPGEGMIHPHRCKTEKALTFQTRQVCGVKITGQLVFRGGERINTFLAVNLLFSRVDKVATEIVTRSGLNAVQILLRLPVTFIGRNQTAHELVF